MPGFGGAVQGKVSYMPKILDSLKPLIDRGASLAGSTLGNVPGPAGALAKRLAGGSAQPKPAMSDPTLKSKVESALYRVPGVTRSKVKVTVAEGVVTVHGEVKTQAQMATIETTARGVPEVKGYESQLHLPKTPAPSTPKAGTRQAKTKKPASATKAAARGRTPRVTAEKPTLAKADTSPKASAAKGEGRKPAELGSKKTAEPSTTPTKPTTPATPATQADSPASTVTSGSKAEGS